MDQSTQLVKILDTIAEEINELGTTIDELQAMLSPALSTIASDADYIRHVQAFDLASQRLNALSTFMSSLNGAIPHHYVVNSSSALSEVKLSALAQRLTGQAHTAQEHISGELDLF
jgi:RNA processing factor Prp31